MVGDGHFRLYGRVMPPLQAGEYLLTADLDLTADGPTADPPRIASLPTHLTVRSPRFALPPDQVLSTYPPAMGVGSYGSRLPQVVFRRRTLPWERHVQSTVPRETPWLALVVVTEGEAELALNQPVAQCVTPGVALSGPADAETGNCLRIRKSTADRVFPTQADVPLLAHAREVDIDDTELMMGDDDGFLAVVIANRLPLPGVGPDGSEVPVKYVACLVNLEGQFTRLPAPPDSPIWATRRLWRDMIMLTDPPPDSAKSPIAGRIERLSSGLTSGPPGLAPKLVSSGAAAVTRSDGRATAPVARADVDLEMAGDLTARVQPGFIAGPAIEHDPVLTFPVLLHWSFTSAGDVTFMSLMQNLSSTLLGSAPDPEPAAAPGGRDPVEITETAHVGLIHRTRRGEPLRAWYRGPFVAHPMEEDPRLELAHAADQIRIVVPDGGEDISLAAAFEIGRLLALAQPSIIAAMLRWRQEGYRAGRSGAIWSDLESVVRSVLGLSAVDPGVLRDPRLGVLLGRGLAGTVALAPERLLGIPVPVVAPGRPLEVAGDAAHVMARGFGLDAHSLAAPGGVLLDELRATPVAHGIVATDPVTSGEHAALSTILGSALAEHLQLLGSSMAQLPLDSLEPGDIGGAL